MYGTELTRRRRFRRKGFPEGNLVVGYVWESCLRGGPSLEVQMEKMTDCHKIFQDKTTWMSGSNQESPRTQFEEMRKFLRDGDTIVIYSLDRLGLVQSEVIDYVSDLFSPERRHDLRILNYDIDTRNPETLRAVEMLLWGLGDLVEIELDREAHQRELLLKAANLGTWEQSDQAVC